MSDGNFLAFTDQAALRLELSRRLRDVLLEGMREDGASTIELEEAAGVLLSTAAMLVDGLGLVLADGVVRVQASR